MKHDWINAKEALHYMSTSSMEAIRTITYSGDCDIPWFYMVFGEITRMYPDDEVGESFTPEDFLTEFVDKTFRKLNPIKI